MFSIKYDIFLDTKIRNEHMKNATDTVHSYFTLQKTYLETKPALNIDFPPLIANTNILMFWFVTLQMPSSIRFIVNDFQMTWSSLTTGLIWI